MKTTNEMKMINLNVVWYIVGAVLLVIAVYFLFRANAFVDNDLKIFGSKFSAMRKQYVGGDAYNYIIAGTYSTTLTVRAVFFALLGSVSLLMGKLKSK
jgi:hypothetical protein